MISFLYYWLNMELFELVLYYCKFYIRLFSGFNFDDDWLFLFIFYELINFLFVYIR